ncbi:probable sphingolipid transporter spinster homolog 2 isoform X1 [Coffea eugenioides]|uniref:probable sphingolipid transporter spinster homolog 2 isoform X1 n=1 Tax=Coffea eugenioides TaxID=49369 RepID=UPI000F613B02|nr:probable sphingolipid transporter spinster homolog 2 isoform X1 [Coffea eugenioides]
MGEDKKKEEEPKPLQISDPTLNPNPSTVIEVSTTPATAVAPMASSSPPKSSWFTPRRVLVIFSVINMLNYLDRGAIASNGVNGSRRTCTKSGTCSAGSGIQGDFNLNNFQDGVLSSAFMVGLLVASPIFASLAKSVNPFRLIGVGLSVWTIAVAGCGFSINFWSISICRMFVGVGEASFVSLAAPFIDDNAPAAQKNAWLGIFYMCIPVGTAVGYVFGGVVGNQLSWRYAFWIEAILMLPFAVLGFLTKPLQLKGFAPAGSRKALTTVETAASDNQGGELSLTGEFVKQNSQLSRSKASTNLNQVTRFLQDLTALLGEKVYVVNVLGYIAYNFVIGSYSYWGPKAGYGLYHMSNADLMFGGVTVVSGVLGTVAGGFLLDRMTSTIPNAFKLLSAVTFTGGIFCFAAFCFKSLYAFMAFLAIGEVLIFATQGPVNFVCLHCVHPSLRPLSMAISTVSIHIFGDVPSAPLVGLIQDHVQNWRISALVLTSIFFIASAIWFIGIFLRSVDRFNEDSQHPVTAADRANTTPLLEDKTAETTAASHEPEPFLLRPASY